MNINIKLNNNSDMLFSALRSKYLPKYFKNYKSQCKHRSADKKQVL